MNSIVSSANDKVTGSPAGASCSKQADDQAEEESPAAGLYRLAMIAADLVEAIGDQATRDREMYNAGWNDAAKLFFEHGFDVGYAQAHGEMAADWKALAEKIRQMANTPTFAELEKRRAQHDDTGYTGGPVEWEPKKADVIEIRRGVA